tara:strand:+ start:1922 stop:2083 length:162 start_codon:yes stop_codon:yes gene_type:complete
MAESEGTFSMRAFLVMNWQILVEGIEVNFLFRNPSQRDDSRSHTFERRASVGS